MVVRGDGLSATMSKYLIDEIETNIQYCGGAAHPGGGGSWRGAAGGAEDQGAAGRVQVPASSLFVFIGAAPGTGWLPDSILRDEKGFLLAGPDLRIDGKLPESWREAAGAVSAGVERSGSVCGRRCAARIGKAGGFGGGRGIDCGAVCAPVPGGILRERRRAAGMSIRRTIRRGRIGAVAGGDRCAAPDACLCARRAQRR